jgi:hypothetical protein
MIYNSYMHIVDGIESLLPLVIEGDEPFGFERAHLGRVGVDSSQLLESLRHAVLRIDEDGPLLLLSLSSYYPLKTSKDANPLKLMNCLLITHCLMQ